MSEWRKSERSAGGADACVELAWSPGARVPRIRDSKNLAGGVISAAGLVALARAWGESK